MNFQRFIGALVALVFWSCAHAGDPVDVDAAAKILAPVGELLVGVYLGSPDQAKPNPNCSG